MANPILVRNVCPHDCPDTCGILTEVDAGRALRVSGDPAHGLTNGWLCAKVRDYLQWVYHPQRVLYPLQREGGKGTARFRRISWSDALSHIASRWKHSINTFGAASILPYSFSGTLGLLQMGVSSSRLWNRIGASGLERSICGAAAEAAIEATLGARWAPDPSDLLHSKLIILWGHNPASTAPHIMPLLRRAQRSGCQIVLIDPRRSLTAQSVDLHLQPHPASDGALALGLMHILLAEGLVDDAWISRHTVGWEQLRAVIRRFRPSRVERLTGIGKQQIIDLARLYGNTRPAMIKTSDGVQRHGNGGQTVRAIACLPALVGQYGVRGGGLFYATSGYLQWHSETVTKQSQCPPAPRTINMNQLGQALTSIAPPVKSLMVFGANPVASTPNASKIVEGLRRDDLFTVVHDLFITDTARYADIVLPATSQLEHIDVHKPYGNRLLQLNRPAIAPLGEARSNWDTMRALAGAMGYQEPWLADDGESVLREIFEATATHYPALQQLSFDQLLQQGWAPLVADTAAVPFSDGHFPTPSGHVELASSMMRRAGLRDTPCFERPAEFRRPVVRHAQHHHPPLVLLTPAAHHFVSSSFAGIESLRRKQGPPRLQINPADAAARGIVDGTQVRVWNQRGSFVIEAAVSEEVAPGVAATPKGYWANDQPDGRNVNWTTPDAVGDMAGQSTFQSNLVWVASQN